MKPNLQKIINEGYREVGYEIGSLPLYEKDDMRLIYNPIDDIIIVKYRFQITQYKYEDETEFKKETDL